MPPARRFRSVAIALASIACAQGRPDAAPDRIYVNGRIWTGDERLPSAEAIATLGDRIVAVGSDSAVRSLATAGTVVTDLGGRRVVPGFNDAHWHLPSRRTADLNSARNVAGIIAALRLFASTLPADAWLTGRGWSPAVFPGNAAHRRYLDSAFADRPVVLTDRDGHQLLANTRALALAGVTAATPDPANGAIDRDARGEPTGVLKEAAMQLVRQLLPPPSPEETYRALLAEVRKASSLGITSLQVAQALGPAVVAAFERAIAEDSLPVRVRGAVPFNAAATSEQLSGYVALRDRHRGGMLTFGIAKGMLDGTVDARTAAMFSPFTGGGTGIPMWEQGALDRTVARYDSAGLQVELHAIGDRAIRMALDAFEHAASANGARDRRHRVEHMEVPDPADIPRFAALGVIASTQAIFVTPDATTLQNYAPLLGPARAARALPFKALDDAGAVQAFGSDYPVFPMDVLLGIYTAVTRQLPDGTPAGGWYPEHRIGIEAALRHYTRDAAYASFEEAEKGTLAPGKLADFVVLSEDILAGPPARLLEAKVVLTVMGGVERHRSPAVAR